MKQIPRAKLNQALAVLVEHAITGARCPITSGPDKHPVLTSHQIYNLAQEGKIFVEISSKNWRRVTILTGPHKGKSTAPNPHKRNRVYQTIGVEGCRVNGKFVDPGARTRNQPSAPRFLTAEELSS